MYEYKATVLSVVDGDTIHARVELGCDVRINLTLRFAGINTPELPTTEGVAAAKFVTDNLPQSFTLRTVRDRREKYGRYLAYLILPDGQCLNRMLVDAGHAAPYGNLPADPPGATP